MAKDGTYRGGRRVKAGSKPDALADKIMKGAPAKRMELPDFTDDMTDFDVDDIGDGVELEGMDMPSPDDYLSAQQKDGKPLGSDKQDYDAIADEIFRLRDQKEQSEVDSHHREETMNRIKELQDFIAGQETDITEFDETLVSRLITKITVFEDHFTIDFKSGVTIDIDA